MDVVDISTVRLVANVVEKDLTELQTGNATRVEVDAFPGEVFTGRIARVSPVLDPATRTAPIEIEIPNPTARLKPGMYARVSVTTSTAKEALVVPATAVVDLGGRRGVFTPLNETAVFRALDLGTEQKDLVEILGGLADGDTVITTGSSALRDGDRIVLPAGAGGRGRRGGATRAPAPAAAAATRRGASAGARARPARPARAARPAGASRPAHARAARAKAVRGEDARPGGAPAAARAWTRQPAAASPAPASPAS